MRDRLDVNDTRSSWLRNVIQASLQTLLHKPLTQSLDGTHANIKRVGNRHIGPAFLLVRLQQNPATAQLASCSGSPSTICRSSFRSSSLNVTTYFFTSDLRFRNIEPLKQIHSTKTRQDQRDTALAACPDSCFDLDFVVGMLYSRLSWQGILFCC
jgi:hypothetical protein